MILMEHDIQWNAPERRAEPDWSDISPLLLQFMNNSKFPFNHYSTYSKTFEDIRTAGTQPTYIIPFYVREILLRSPQPTIEESTILEKLYSSTDFIASLVAYMRLKSYEEKLYSIARSDTTDILCAEEMTILMQQVSDLFLASALSMYHTIVHVVSTNELPQWKHPRIDDITIASRHAAPICHTNPPVFIQHLRQTIGC